MSIKVILINNIDTTDGLTNGQLGELIDTIKTKNGDVEKLIINLKKKGSGAKNRKRFIEARSA